MSKKVAVIGLGYVGLPIAVRLAQQNHAVTGYDIDKKKIEALKSNQSPVETVTASMLTQVRGTGQLSVTDEKKALSEKDGYIIAVPTDYDEKKQKPDLTAVKSALNTAGQAGNEESVFIITSTVPPNIEQYTAAPVLKKAGIRSPNIAVAPERISPGTSNDNVEDVPVVVGGNNKKAEEKTKDIYSDIADSIHCVSNTEVAAAAKLIENTYRLINISAINEIASYSNYTDINIWEAIKAAKTKPFGYEAFWPGTGAGGHCIPVDPKFLTWHANRCGWPLSITDEASSVNDRMPTIVANRIYNELKNKQIENEDVLCIGASYKPGVFDDRNSTAIKVIEKLNQKGAAISVYDPYCPNRHNIKEKYNWFDELEKGVEKTSSTILLVNYDSLDHDALLKTNFLFDTTGYYEQYDRSNIFVFGS